MAETFAPLNLSPMLTLGFPLLTYLSATTVTKKAQPAAERIPQGPLVCCIVIVVSEVVVIVIEDTFVLEIGNTIAPKVAPMMSAIIESPTVTSKLRRLLPLLISESNC